MSVAFRAMDTDVRIVLPQASGSRERALARKVERLFARVDKVFSRFRDDSELSRLNADGGTVMASDAMLEALTRAQAYHAMTDGWFDVTVGASLRAAGYDRSFVAGGMDREKPLHPGVVADYVVDRTRRTVTLSQGAQLDCGGFIKGWAVDRALECLPSPCAVDAGGDARVRGGTWRIDVEDPTRAGRPLFAFPLTDQAVATSGISRRRWRVSGRIAHHLIDPFTGLPSESDLAQVTVVAGSTELADVLAKTAFLQGLSEGRRFLERFPVTAVLVGRDGELHLLGKVAR